MFADERRGAIHLDHGEAPAGRRDSVALAHVRLFSNPQRVRLGLKGIPIDDLRGSRFISHDVVHRSLL
jgi:hypothetical protein